jgi:hypothetical protein
VHIMQTKHFISPSVTCLQSYRSHKTSENTHIEENIFFVKISQGHIKLKLIGSEGVLPFSYFSQNGRNGFIAFCNETFRIQVFSFSSTAL